MVLSVKSSFAQKEENDDNNEPREKASTVNWEPGLKRKSKSVDIKLGTRVELESEIAYREFAARRAPLVPPLDVLSELV